MSWSGFLLLSYGNNDRDGWLKLVCIAIIRQILFFLAAFLIFQQWTPLSILINLVLVEYFTFLTLAAIFVVIFQVSFDPIDLILNIAFTDFSNFLIDLNERCQYLVMGVIAFTRWAWSMAIISLVAGLIIYAWLQNPSRINCSDRSEDKDGAVGR